MTATENARPQDLARIALRSALASNHDRTGDTPVNRARSRPSAARTDDRDPQPLAGLMRQLLADRGWVAPVIGGSLADTWPRACPEYADTVTAGHYDPATGRLDLHPTTHAHATQLRLMGRSLVERLNAAVSTTGTVRSLRVLPPGTASGAKTQAHPGPPRGDQAPTLPQPRRESAPGRPHPDTPRPPGHTSPQPPETVPGDAWARAIARARREHHQARGGAHVEETGTARRGR